MLDFRSLFSCCSWKSDTYGGFFELNDSRVEELLERMGSGFVSARELARLMGSCWTTLEVSS